jgi:hypothetical protein
MVSATHNALGQSEAAAPRDYSFSISTAPPWTDTGVDLQAGELLAVTTSASSGANSCDPAGVGGAAEGTGLPVAKPEP